MNGIASSAMLANLLLSLVVAQYLLRSYPYIVSLAGSHGILLIRKVGIERTVASLEKK